MRTVISTCVRLVFLASVGVGTTACRNVLGVPVPAGVINPGALGGMDGAEAQRLGAIAAFANAFDVQYSGLLSDEFTSYFLQGNSFSFATFFVDARSAASSVVNTSSGGIGQYQFTDPVYLRLQQARINARLAAPFLAGSASEQVHGEVGEMFALSGYADVLLAEEFCAGVPLSDVLPGGGKQYGVPLTTDSLLGRAVADFDSALATGVGNDTVLNLARVGLGRALVDRGRYVDAAAAVATVPTGFTYAILLPAAAQGSTQANYYSSLVPAAPAGHFANVSDREGGTGLNFVSARDPRMPIDSTLGPTVVGTTYYYPAKFSITGVPPVTLADWIEARLIQAEAALQTGDFVGWGTALDALRADSADTHISGLPALTPDSTTGAGPAERVDVMFRERAFWMFGTGHRLGDLRRLIRQYGRGSETVFPTGPYPATGVPPGLGRIASYGSDVNFPIQAVEQANPHFHGCLNRAA